MSLYVVIICRTMIWWALNVNPSKAPPPPPKSQSAHSVLLSPFPWGTQFQTNCLECVSHGNWRRAMQRRQVTNEPDIQTSLKKTSYPQSETHSHLKYVSFWKFSRMTGVRNLIPSEHRSMMTNPGLIDMPGFSDWLLFNALSLMIGGFRSAVYSSSASNSTTGRLLHHTFFSYFEEKPKICLDAAKAKQRAPSPNRAHPERAFNSPSAVSTVSCARATTLSALARELPSTWPPCSSICPLRFSSWRATLPATTRRPGLFPVIFSWPSETTRSWTSCWAAWPSLKAVCCPTSRPCCCPRKPRRRRKHKVARSCFGTTNGSFRSHHICERNDRIAPNRARPTITITKTFPRAPLKLCKPSNFLAHIESMSFPKLYSYWQVVHFHLSGCATGRDSYKSARGLAGK